MCAQPDAESFENVSYRKAMPECSDIRVSFVVSARSLGRLVADLSVR